MTDLLEQVKEALEGATPGPWAQLHSCILAKGSTNVVSGAVLGSIARCTSLFETDGEGREWCARGTPEDNARLIAMAPTMARALIAQEQRLKAADELAEAVGSERIARHDYQHNRALGDPDMDLPLRHLLREKELAVGAALAAYRATGGSDD